MQEFLTNLYSGTTVPLLSALILGLLTAVAPCPLTINITAIGYIGKDVGSRRKVFLNGVFYTLGTLFSYTALAIILYFTADKTPISGFLQKHSEQIIGPLLLLIGLSMVGFVNINFPGMNRAAKRFENRSGFRYWDAFLLGSLLALAFCPYSGVLYFGTLIPLIIGSSTPSLSIVFSLGAGLPVVLFAWMLAFTVEGIGKLFNRIKAFQFWFGKLVAVLFMGIGIYYIVITWFLNYP